MAFKSQRSKLEKAKPYKKKQKPQMFLNERFFQALEKMCNNQGWWYIKYDEHGQYAGMAIDFGGPRKEQEV
jgi:hypothetical protein